MTILTDAQIVSVAKYGGFTMGTGYQGEGLAWAVAECLAESSGNPQATGYNAGPPVSFDRGLWQINSYYHAEYSDGTCYDPYGCAQAAFVISGGGNNWTPWATFGSGAAAAQLPRALAAIAGTPYAGAPVTGSLPPMSQTQVSAQSVITAALNFARAQLGKPYVFGATGPDSFDCSGLTQASYAAGHLHIPRTSQLQFEAGPQVDLRTVQPGDLIFSNFGPDNLPDHVGIYEGNGLLIEAPHTGDVVKRFPLADFGARGATRPTNVVLPPIGGGSGVIIGCTPPAPVAPVNDIALVETGTDLVVHFMSKPLSVGASAAPGSTGTKP